MIKKQCYVLRLLWHIGISSDCKQNVSSITVGDYKLFSNAYFVQIATEYTVPWIQSKYRIGCLNTRLSSYTLVHTGYSVNLKIKLHA